MCIAMMGMAGSKSSQHSSKTITMLHYRRANWMYGASRRLGKFAAKADRARSDHHATIDQSLEYCETRFDDSANNHTELVERRVEQARLQKHAEDQQDDCHASLQERIDDKGKSIGNSVDKHALGDRQGQASTLRKEIGILSDHHATSDKS